RARDRGEGLPGRAAAALRGVGLAPPRPEGGDPGGRSVRGRPRGVLRAVPRARAGRRLGQRRPADDAAVADRVAWGRAPARRAPGLRRRPDDALEPRLAEPRGNWAGRAG